jgi:5-methylcytosine-specific restriction endonuclease McrA
MLSYSEQMQHPLWIAKREQIFKRDNHSCKICGDSTHRIQVHHLCYFPDLLAWEYDDELMKTVCLKHHNQLTYDMPKLAGLISWNILFGKTQIP